jgi:competence protein ComEC
MIRLRIGYLITGIITGCILVFSFIGTIPDGKLHIVFCDVGQGDGIYIRFPDGRDMVVDGGMGTKIISCLSHHMPFWDRTIDIALLTHPQKDHMDGLTAVLSRYTVSYLLRSDVENTTEGFTLLKKTTEDRHVNEKLVTTGEEISVGAVHLSILWPTKEQLARMNSSRLSLDATKSVLGTWVKAPTPTSAEANVNDASVVFSLSYGAFDALFPGDADSHVQPGLLTSLKHGFARDGILDLLKVPHHGSKTGMTDVFLQKISPEIRHTVGSFSGLDSQQPLAVISVGKNSYGHPAPEVLEKLAQAGFQALRTDTGGDIEVVSDGTGWVYKKGK